MSIEAMKRALKTFEKIHEGCAFVKEDDLHKDAKDLATYVQEDCEFTMKTLRQAIEQAEQWDTSDMAHRSGGLSVEQAEKQAPTKLFGPNLEQILNAAGFYKRDAVCCGDYKKCIEPCTPKGEWLAKQELAKPEPVTWAETNDLVCALLRQAHDVLACASYPFKRPWVGLTDEEIKCILDCGRGGLVDIKKAEQILREKNA
jgi:hypothetical protein